MARDEMTLYERWNKDLTFGPVVFWDPDEGNWTASLEPRSEAWREFFTWREAYDWLYGEVYGTD